MILSKPCITYPAGIMGIDADYAFNPGFFRWAGQDRLVVRCQNRLPAGGFSDSWLEMVTLGGHLDFRPLARHCLEMGHPSPEDPRCWEYAGRMHVSYAAKSSTAGGLRCRQAVTVLGADLTPGGHHELSTDFPLREIEKNWTFFTDDRQRLLCHYSASPTFRILEVNPRTWHCTTLADHALPAVKWPWGEVRGGTPPVRLGGQYFTFFHSRFFAPTPICQHAIYTFGLLCFDAQTYRPLGMSRVPIDLPGLEDETPVGARVIFPTGAIYHAGLGTRDGLWRVAAGYHDLAVRIYAFEHAELTHPMNWIWF